MLDRWHDECGIFGIYNHPEAANITYLGLYALQHRGQESAGIVTSDETKMSAQVGMGLVQEIFDEETIATLPGCHAIGHVRYSTTGSSILKNAQPFFVETVHGPIGFAHNGNLVNAPELRSELEHRGSIFQSTADTEVIAHLYARSHREKLVDRLIDALKHVQGAYSLVALVEKRLIAVRDPTGFRPLVLGRVKDSYVVASETCALDLVEGEYLREVEPGEVVMISSKGLESFRPFPPAEPRQCIFEYIYFARPDSTVFGQPVYTVRKAFGHELAREHPVDADVVVPVPDSGIVAALGYAEESGIPFEMGLIRNHYVGRTFIEPEQSIRHFGVKLKLNAVRGVIQGKRVVVVDDSIVRGTTSRKIVKMLREAGAREVHMRVSSPPTCYPCYFGVDTPTRKELIASCYPIGEITQFLTADSLGYLSHEGLRRATKEGPYVFCDACFTGNYPVRADRPEGTQLGLF
ncbi:MAG: amidophosphoribosyltransferase [Deltaproteobacteria bacterium]|nr:amidophosphoribosyltransferase [Deltaproteobacteria bacterium]